MERISKRDYYLNIAAEVSKRGTCLRRNYGCIIVKNDEIISTGYTGAPRGQENCSDTGKCERQRLNIASGQQYEKCKSVHAEMNAIISAARKDMLGATLYLAGYDVEKEDAVQTAMPCDICSKMIINAGIKEVISSNYYWIIPQNKYL